MDDDLQIMKTVTLEIKTIDDYLSNKFLCARVDYVEEIKTKLGYCFSIVSNQTQCQ
jgi:hypothetical protein